MKYSVVIHVENKNLCKIHQISTKYFKIFSVVDQDPKPGSIKQRLELQFFIVIHF